MAIKVISNQTFLSDYEKARHDFLIEVEQLLNVVSPSVAMLLGISVNYQLCILQELVRGETLAHRIYEN